MGEAYFYLKARFFTKEQAEKAMPKVKAFLEEGIKSYDWWQGNKRMSPEEFWPNFDALFPNVKRYLDECNVPRARYSPLCDNNHGLDGLLEFGSPDDIDNLHLQGRAVCYSAEIWHFATWDPLARFLQKEHGALSAGSLSEEDVTIDYYDLIS